MPVQRLWLTDFRNYHSLDISLPDGLTVIIGNNGVEKIVELNLSDEEKNNFANSVESVKKLFEAAKKIDLKLI